MYAIKKKMRAALGAVMRIRSFLNKKAMLTLYHSLILSHVRYCVINWCFGNETIGNETIVTAQMLWKRNNCNSSDALETKQL